MADSTTPPDPASQLAMVIDLLAKISAAEQGLIGTDARRHVDELKQQVEGVELATRLKVDELDKRKRAAEAIEKLIDSLGRIQSDAGRAIAKQSPQLKATLRGAELDKLAEGLRMLVRWLHDPSTEHRGAVEQMVANLSRLTGAAPVYDNAATQARLKAELEADVRTSIAEIFNKKPAKPL